MQRQQKKLQKVKQIRKKRKINMQIEEINIEGKKIGTHEVSDKIFSLKPRKDLIQLVINWQMNEQMKKKGHTKSRGEVKGSRRKIVQQKGSGGARHGNITAPIFVGGGIAHGPRHRGKTAHAKLNKSSRSRRRFCWARWRCRP